MREAVHKTTCGVDNHPRSTGTLYWKTWSCQLEKGGSLEISSSQKLYDIVRLTGADRITSASYSVIVERRILYLRLQTAPTLVTEQRHSFFISNIRIYLDVHIGYIVSVDFVPNQKHSVKPSKYCYSSYALNNPINPNAFETSTPGWLCRARLSSRVIMKLIPICVKLKSCSVNKWLPLGGPVNDTRQWMKAKGNNCRWCWALQIIS